MHLFPGPNWMKESGVLLNRLNTQHLCLLLAAMAVPHGGEARAVLNHAVQLITDGFTCQPRMQRKADYRKFAAVSLPHVCSSAVLAILTPWASNCC